MAYRRCNSCGKMVEEQNTRRCECCGNTMCDECHTVNGGKCDRCNEEIVKKQNFD